MIVNVSYLNSPLDGKELILKENMWLTAKPLYKNIDIPWDMMHVLVRSDYRQISPYQFERKTKKTENWRNDNQNLLILDIDDGLSIEEARDVFREYTYLIYTTKTHQKEKKGLTCDRFRIIIPSNNIPQGDEYFDFIRELENKYPFVDKQPHNKTGAFLGNGKCEYIYNKGIFFNCKPLFELSQARKQISTNKLPRETNSNKDIDLDLIKNSLSREIVADVVTSLGYDVNSNFKFKYRLDENTASASISNRQNPLIKDFGSDLSCDVFGFVMEVKNVDFKESIQYVKGFV